MMAGNGEIPWIVVSLLLLFSANATDTGKIMI